MPPRLFLILSLSKDARRSCERYLRSSASICGFEFFSERIEGPEAFGDGQVDRHDRDRHDGEGGGERDVAGRALVQIDGHADEGPRVADDAGNDVVAQGQREGEDRAGGDAGNSERGNSLSILTEGREALRENEARTEFSFDLSGGFGGNVYRLNWDVGDSVTAAWGGVERNVRITEAEINLDSGGETLSIKTEDE